MVGLMGNNEGFSLKSLGIYENVDYTSFPVPIISHCFRICYNILRGGISNEKFNYFVDEFNC
jgi:hypothetical protein